MIYPLSFAGKNFYSEITSFIRFYKFQLFEENTYEFTLAGSADEVTPALIKGDLDMACVPANLAAVLYGKTDGAVEVLAVNTLGVLYIVENGDAVQSMADLKGQTIVAAGKGRVVLTMAVP